MQMTVEEADALVYAIDVKLREAKKLAELLAYAPETDPYYRQRMRAANVRVALREVIR